MSATPEQEVWETEAILRRAAERAASLSATTADVLAAEQVRLLLELNHRVLALLHEATRQSPSVGWGRFGLR